MKKDFVYLGREKVLGQLMAGFKREETLNLNQLRELEEQLSAEELKICADTLAVMRVRALFESGKYVQALHVLTNGLRACPLSLSLQAERNKVLPAAQSALLDLMHQDPLNPVIESLYEILKKEAAVHVWHQTDFLKLLVGQERFVEAARLAVPLVALQPSLLNLREQVEQICARAPHPLLNSFLLSDAVKVGRQVFTSEISPDKAFVLVEKRASVWKAVIEEVPVHLIERQLREVIGELSVDSALDTHLKDFYYVQAILEERKENFFEALMLFRSLVEMDPCNLFFRRSLETEMGKVCESFVEQAQKGTLKVDLVKAYPVLCEIGFVRYELLTQVCLAEVRQGLTAEAKEKMMYLVALNPHDSDYLEEALLVAEASQDEAWQGELLLCLQRIREERPWDLKLQLKNNPAEPAAA